MIAYKGLGDLGGFTSDLAAAIDQAVADGVDVINYSVGSSSPSLTGSDCIAYLFAADAGVFVATSAGNSGPGDATIGGPASVPWLTSVGASSHSRAFISNIRLLGPGTPPTGLWGGSVTHGITNFNKGDRIELDLELITLPRTADDYYGPNEVFRKHLAEHPSSWKTTYREAKGNDLSVVVTGGRALQNL